MKLVLLTNGSPIQERIARLIRAGDDPDEVVILTPTNSKIIDEVIREIRPVHQTSLGGLEFVASIRDRFPRIPILLLTEQGESDFSVAILIDHGSTSHLAQVLPEISGIDSKKSTHEFRYLLENDADLLLRFPPFFVQTLIKLGVCCEKTARLRIAIALEEALTNALYHGNLEVSSSLREQDDSAFYTLAKKRAGEAPYNQRRIHLTVRIAAEYAAFIVRDEGPGFDHSKLPDPTDPENLIRPYGRGVLLIQTFMDEVRYNAKGNEITLVKNREC